MKDLIKILIALAFIAGAFWFGNNEANEKCKIHVNELKRKSEIDKKQILQLHDSLNFLKTELEKARINIDKLKPKQVIKQKKK